MASNRWNLEDYGSASSPSSEDAAYFASSRSSYPSMQSFVERQPRHQDVTLEDAYRARPRGTLPGISRQSRRSRYPLLLGFHMTVCTQPQQSIYIPCVACLRPLTTITFRTTHIPPSPQTTISLCPPLPSRTLPPAAATTTTTTTSALSHA